MNSGMIAGRRRSDNSTPPVLTRHETAYRRALSMSAPVGDRSDPMCELPTR
jgi:hypothetical protein